MNEGFEKLKKIYNNVFQITLIINSVLKKDNYSAGVLALEKRGNLLKEADKLRAENQFTDEEKNQLNDLIDKIKELDEKNTEKLMSDKSVKQELLSKVNKNVKQELLLKVNKNKKLISAYKSRKMEIAPKIFDSFE